MNPLQALYQLQMLETSLDSAKDRVAEITEALENDADVVRCKEELEVSDEQFQQAQAVVKDLELEIASLETKINEGEKILYGGTVKNPKELQDRENENVSLKRRREARNGDLLKAIDELELAQVAQQEATEALTQAKEAQQVNNRELITEGESLHKQMKEWLAARKRVLKNVDKEHHKIYKQLKPQKNGVAVIRLDGRTCTSCRMEQNQTIIYQVHQGGQLVRCHNCGRILVQI